MFHGGSVSDANEVDEMLDVKMHDICRLSHRSKTKNRMPTAPQAPPCNAHPPPLQAPLKAAQPSRQLQQQPLHMPRPLELTLTEPSQLTRRTPPTRAVAEP